jgi:hypothetical protein
MELRMFSFDGLSVGSVLAGLIATGIFVVLGKVVVFAAGRGIVGRVIFFASNSFGWRVGVFLVISVGLALANSMMPGIQTNPWLVAAVTWAGLILYTQWKFAYVGIHSAQLSVKGGTNYRAALNLCRNNFSILGTGASKLTAEKGFEKAILRCNRERAPVRFLLATPDNKVIADAERVADVSPGAYRHNVIKSLKILKRLHDDSGAKFEVRFYKGETASDFENFRMMFIDDDILLLSYNVYGKGNGQDTPQLVLFKGKINSSTESFYFACTNYFDRLWETSQPWDFSAYVS